MNLEEFISDIGQSVVKEEKTVEDENKEAEKFVKNIQKVRFNSMFKNIDRISTFMFDLGSTVRGVVKTTILSGARDLFKQSKERSAEYRKSKDDLLNKHVNVFIEKLDYNKSVAEFIEDVEFERLSFERIMEQLSSMMMAGVSTNDQLTFFTTQFLKKEMLDSPEERKYYERSGEIIEYFVIETMKLRIVFSCIQTVIARIVSKTRLSKTEGAEKKAKETGRILIKFFKEYVSNKYGNAIGEYLSTYVEDYYQSTDDQKEQFTKFENLINILLGVRKA